MKQRSKTTTRVVEDKTVAEPKKAGKFEPVDSLLNNEGPLDEQEQEKLILEFEKLQQQSNMMWRRVFGAGAVLWSLFFLHAIWSQYFYPWQLRYIGEFQSVVTSRQAIDMLLVQGLGLVASAMGLFKDFSDPGPAKESAGAAAAAGGSPAEEPSSPAARQHGVLVVGTLATFVAGIFWSAKLFDMAYKFGPSVGIKWELAWLPAAPFVYALICHLVLWMLRDSKLGVDQLKKLKYDFKKV